jgi:hypothetical protein
LSDLVKVNVITMTAVADRLMELDGTPKRRTVDLGGYTRDEDVYATTYLRPGEHMLPQDKAEKLVEQGHAAWPVVVTPQVPAVQANKGKKIAADPLS